MVPGAEACSGPSSAARTLLFDELIACGSGQSHTRALVLHAPRGWGKRTLLESAILKLSGSPGIIARADFNRCVTNPDEFAVCLAAALLESLRLPVPASHALPGPTGEPPAAAKIRGLAASAEIRRLPSVDAAVTALMSELSRRRSRPGEVISRLFELLTCLLADVSDPLLLIALGFDEIGRLVHYPGLADANERFARELAKEPRLRLIATASPAGRPSLLFSAMTREMGDRFAVRGMPPLDASDLPAAMTDLFRLTAGRPLTATILLEHLGDSATLHEALSAAFRPGGGRLHAELRFDYNLLLERSRGYAASRAILHTLSREEGLDLSGLSAKLRRSAGSTLDYLKWLIEVDLLRRDGRRYLFADPLMRLYILAHELPESPSDDGGLRSLTARFIASRGEPPPSLRPLGRPRGRSDTRPRGPRARRSPPGEETARRSDSLIEID